MNQEHYGATGTRLARGVPWMFTESDMTDLDYTCVYVVQFGNLVKIGISKNPWSRLGSLQTANPEPISMPYMVFVPTRAIAREVEQRMHRKLAARRVRGEWFRVDVEAAMDLTTKVADQVLFGRRPRPKTMSFASASEAANFAENHPEALRASVTNFALV